MTTVRLNGGGMAPPQKSGRRDGESVDSTAERINEAECGKCPFIGARVGYKQ